jgi:hypothetical protein
MTFCSTRPGPWGGVHLSWYDSAHPTWDRLSWLTGTTSGPLCRDHNDRYGTPSPLISSYLNNLFAGQVYPLVYPRVILIDIVSLYLQIPLFLVCFIAWKVLAQTKVVRLDIVDLSVDEYILDDGTREQMEAEERQRQGRLKGFGSWKWRLYYWLA